MQIFPFPSDDTGSGDNTQTQLLPADTSRCRYNAVNFIKIIHKRHSIARPLGRGKECLLWIQHLIDVLPRQLLLQYVIILDRVITALDYNGLKRLHHTHTPLDPIYRSSNLCIRCFEKTPHIVNNDVMCQQSNMFWEPKYMLLVAYITAYVVMYKLIT